MNVLFSSSMHSNISKLQFSHKVFQSTKVSTIPSPKGLPIIGTMLDLIRAGSGPKLHLYIDSRHKQLGPVFKERIGPVDAVFVSDPTEIHKIFKHEGKYPVHFLPDTWLLYNKIFSRERGLYFMNGEEWYNYRKIMNKLLLKNDIQKSIIEETYESVVKDFVSTWESFVNKEAEDVSGLLYRLATSYSVACIVGSTYPENKAMFSDNISKLSTVVSQIFYESCKLSLLPAKVSSALRLPPWRHFVAAVDSTMQLSGELVKSLSAVGAEDGLYKKLIAENVPRDKIFTILVDLIIAGADTTAYTTQWALYLLGKHKDIQNKIAIEVKTSPLDTWFQSPLLKGVIRETLRLYPAAPFITRILPNDTEIGGYIIPAGQLVIISIYTSGNNEKYFLDPKKFWPERWTRPDGVNYCAVNDANASVPFAIGARSCIGRKIAEAEIILTLGELLSNYHIDTVEDVNMILKLVPVPEKPIRLKVTK